MRLNHRTPRTAKVFVGGILLAAMAPATADAHWCDDLWASSYNVVVRPETTTLTVPASGTATFNVFVQNNMGYQMINFAFGGTAPGATISTKLADTLKVPGTLLPGERAKYAVTVTKNGGGTVNVQDINFSVRFGNPGQSVCYPAGQGARAAAVVNPDGTVAPGKPMPGIGSMSCAGAGQQSSALVYSALADFENETTGLDKLMSLYCAGRGSWNSTSDAVIPTYCPNPTTTNCPDKRPTGVGTKYDYNHLWAAGELAARKSALGARLPVFRARLQCATKDGDSGFAGFALFVLGYLGDDPGARTFIQSKVADSSLGLIAKAALYVAGNPEDKAAYAADVRAGISSNDLFSKVACAAALGIADKDDAAVSSALIPNVKWIEPDTDDDGKAMYSAHMLHLVAWSRRGWTSGGVDHGPVSFYGDTEGTSTTGGTTGSPGATGGARSGAGGSPAGTTGGGASGTGGGAGGVGGATSSSSATTASGGGSVSTSSGGGGTSSGVATAGRGGGSGGKAGSTGSPGGSGGSQAVTTASDAAPGGCGCRIGGQARGTSVGYILAGTALAFAFVRRRRSPTPSNR